MLDEKVQLEILNEIVEKSDGEKPFCIDLSDKIRAFNFNFLHNSKCIMLDEERLQHDALVALFSETGNFTAPVIFGLTEFGFVCQASLRKKLEKEQWEREKVEQSLAVARETNAIALSANAISAQSLETARESNKYAEKSIAEAKGANFIAWVAIGISVVCALIASGFWFRLIGC